MAKKPLRVDTLTHNEATRKNAPTAELETFVDPEVKRPIQVAYKRRNRDLDPQLVWRGKDVADWSDLIVEAPPLYIQEKIHPKALIEDLKRASQRDEPDDAPDLFADFNGIEPDQRTEFYAHDQHWSNRMILGDGLKVMASLAEREGLKGQVQCIYIDPPYGIKFNSNFQWSTTSRDVKDGKADHLTREPEQVKAFRDTWADGIHSYLTYLRDRLTVARDLLTESGSVFVQIGDENVHRVRALMDEVFGEENFVAQIAVKKTSGATSEFLPGTVDYVLLFAKQKTALKFRQMYLGRKVGGDGDATYTYFDDLAGSRTRLSTSEINDLSFDDSKQVYRLQTMTSQSVGRSKGEGAEKHRQQCRDRHYLGGVSGKARTPARRDQCDAWPRRLRPRPPSLRGMDHAARTRLAMAGGCGQGAGEGPQRKCSPGDPHQMAQRRERGDGARLHARNAA